MDEESEQNSRPSKEADYLVVGRDHVEKLGPYLMQKNLKGAVIEIQGRQDNGSEDRTGNQEDHDMEPWQQYFRRLFPKHFNRTGKIEIS